MLLRGGLCWPGDSGLTGRGPGARGMCPCCPQSLGGGATTEREQHPYSHTFPVPMFHLDFILLFPSLHQPWGTNENSATDLAAESPQIPGTGHSSGGLSFTLLCWHSTEGFGRYSWKKIASSGYPQLLRLHEVGSGSHMVKKGPGESSRDQSGSSEVSHGEISLCLVMSKELTLPIPSLLAQAWH